MNFESIGILPKQNRFRRGIVLALSLLLLASAAGAEIRDYEKAATFEVGVYGTMTLYYRLDPGNTDLPLITFRFGHNMLSPHEDEDRTVELLDFQFHNFSPGNHLDIEFRIQLPRVVSPTPVTLRYREALDDSHQHQPNKYERNYPEDLQKELGKVRGHIFQLDGPKLIGLVVKQLSGGLPRFHWVGDFRYKDGIEGVPNTPLDGMETQFLSFQLRSDHRAANGGMDTAYELVADVNDLMETGEIGKRVDSPDSGSLEFSEFFSDRTASDVGRSPLVEVQMVPKTQITKEERGNGRYFYHAMIGLSTDLGLELRDQMMEHLKRILAGKPSECPVPGVWLRFPLLFRANAAKGIATTDKFYFYPFDVKFPQWHFNLDERFEPSGESLVELHRTPLILPYLEVIPSSSSRPDPVDWWKEPELDASASGSLTRISVWTPESISSHGPDVTLLELIQDDGRCRHLLDPNSK